MHFNDLLIRIRSQSLGAVAAVSTGAGVFLKTEAQTTQWGTLAAVFLLLLAFWAAVFCLDILYYNRLLIGAVNTLLLLERRLNCDFQSHQVLLSTFIEKAVKDGRLLILDSDGNESWARSWASRGILFFYGIVAVLLIVAVCWSYWRFKVPGRSTFAFE